MVTKGARQIIATTTGTTTTIPTKTTITTMRLDAWTKSE